jgi:hypothetical protein
MYMNQSFNQSINKQVAVLAYYFSSAKCFPKKVQLENGQELNFVESGLRCLVKKGQEIIQIFNMSDGTNQYRLRFEPENRLWTLLSTQAQA